MKVIVPAAGVGTRMLPLTKAVPKELLPVGSKPAIQWVFEEAVGAGLREFIVVISPHKGVVRDFLTPLEGHHPLADHTGLEYLELLLSKVHITFIEQPEPRGLRDAVSRCAGIVENEPFALVLPDNVALKSDLLRELLNVQDRTGKSCMAVSPMDRSLRRLKTASHVVIMDAGDDRVAPVRQVVPSVSRSSYPQSWRVGIGRYVFGQGVMDLFCTHGHPDTGGEQNEVRVLNALAGDGAIYAIESDSAIWHIGLMDEYLAASVSCANVKVRRGKT